MGFFSRKKKGKVMVVGLDGMPCSLLKKLIADGVTPNIGRIAGGNAPTQMQVVYPEISAVSWPSFMTGKGPGGHGIFGFTDLKPETYELYFPNYASLQAPTIWESLGEKGKRSIVINQPSTYPARKLEGALISGFVAVDLFKSVYPSKYLGGLKRMNYEVDIDTERSRKNADFLFTQLSRTLKTREQAYELLLKKEEDWDYLELVLTGTDRMQHYQMHAILNEAEENHQRTMDYYHAIDAFVGRMYDRYCQDTKSEGENFLMLSDHGFTQIKQEVNITRWLEDQGYLSFEGESRRIADISPESKAFALDPGRIYIHRAGRFPKGGVQADEADALIKEIRDKLRGMEFEGEAVIQDVFTPDQIYDGPFTRHSADLIGWAHWGYDLKASTGTGEIFRKTDLTGMHTQNDAFLISQGKFEDGVHITELADYILSKY